MGLFDVFKKSESAQPLRSPQPPIAATIHSYSKGDVIGNKYEVYGVLGRGGCGVVYQVYSRETGSVYALKTFLDKYLSDLSIRDRFKKEASVWISLEKHPYIVTARFVEEISGRLYIGLDYIEPPDAGWNTLEDYLRYQRVDLIQGLKWAIQFCYGMEYAYSRGIKAHRDIKPANIMIDVNKSVKISDFGLAGFIDARSDYGKQANFENDRQTMINVGMGTPTHMSPEQFDNALECDERSDIYSFGVVLYQLASRGDLPFTTDNRTQYWQILNHMHKISKVPELGTSFDKIIQCCMAKNPSDRFNSFAQIRTSLEKILLQESNEVVVVPDEYSMTALDINARGLSLNNIGKYLEAIELYNKALSINPSLGIAYSNKGLSLYNMNRYYEAISCLSTSLNINKNNTSAWCNLGLCFQAKCEYEHAIECYNLSYKTDSNQYLDCYNIGNVKYFQGDYIEAIKWYDLSLSIFLNYSAAWSNKGKSLIALKMYDEAILCLNKSLDINPMSHYAWYNKGLCLQYMKKYNESIACFDKSLSINTDTVAWNSKGDSCRMLKQLDRAMDCYQNALDIRANCVESLRSKILCFWEMGQAFDALMFSKISLMIAPDDNVILFLKAELEDNLGMHKEACDSYKKFVNIANSIWHEQIARAKGRIEILERLCDSAQR